MADKPDGIWDKALKEVGFAVEDIRHKVVEKPWFGETVTPSSIWNVPGLEQDGDGKEVEASDLYGRDADTADRGDWHVEGLDPDADRDGDVEPAELYGHDRERDVER